MCDLGYRKFLVHHFPSNSDEPDHDVITVGFGKNFKMSLTSLTEEELHAFYEGVTLAVKAALPTVRMLDKEAQDGYEAGNLPRQRFYRRVPVIAVKRWVFGRNAEGIQDRFTRVVILDQQKYGTPLPDPTGLAGSGVTRRAVPERDPLYLGTSNGGPEADEYEDLGEDERERQFPEEVPSPEDR